MRNSKRPPRISKTDWDAVDVPELAEGDFRRMRPAMEALPLALKRAIGQRGPGKKPAKVAVSLRLDEDTVERFKRGGPGWQSRMNDALRSAAKRSLAK